MPKPFLLLLLILPASLLAQKDSTQKGWAATFTVTAVPIGQPGLGIQPGVEYRFNDRYSLLAEVAFRANKNISKDSSEFDKHYLKFKTELRYHMPGNKGRWGHEYFAFQLSHTTRTFTTRNGFYHGDLPGDSVYYYSQAAIKSPVTTASVQFGTILTEGRFALDAFIGIGARFINTSISDIKNQAKGIHTPEGLHFTASYSYAGNKTMFHLNGGIRFMWHFYHFKHPRKQ
ncbi:MAG: outer membrane beta-barrel protein [Chitinophagaceae bacterium]|nr:outer membrane beta-barrel protein [Chitinophagaceae bacterium]